MARILALLLVLHVVAADIARGFDLHAEVGCADSAAAGSFGSESSDSAPADSGTGGAPPKSHTGDCCFGSLVMGSPAAPVSPVSFVSITAPIACANTRGANWYSDGPERPPRP